MLLGVDVGGTFTDAVLLDRDEIHSAKVPTTPGEESTGVMRAVAAVLARAGAEPAAVEVFAHGMTVGTNALLEERGARTALVATRGFADVIEIGRQNRPDLYKLCEPKPEPLVARDLRFEVDERIGPEGVIEPLGAGEPERIAALLEETGAESVAICLLFSYLDPSHERRLAAHLRERLPGVHVSASHEVLPRFREYERCSTTVIDAYLSPLLGRYLGQLGEATAAAGLPQPLVMRSSGGVAPAEEAARSGAWSVLSGPAGGAVGAGLLARRSGDGNALGFDMGGTSCDVCVVEDGAVRRTDSRQIGGRTIQLPMVDVHTVGAGGGSSGGATRAEPCGSARARPAPIPAPPVTGAAAPSRRSPTPTSCSATSPPTRAWPATSPSTPAQRRPQSTASPPSSGWSGCNRGRDRPRRQPGDAAGAAGGHGRARDRPARLRADAVRRRRPDARGGDRRRAGDRDDPLPPRQRRPLRPRPLRIGAPPRHRPHGDAERRGAERGADRRRGERPGCHRRRRPRGGGPEVTYELRYAGQAFQLPVPGPVDPDPADLVAGFEQLHEERYGHRDPDGEVVLVDIGLALVVPGPEPRPRAAEAPLEETSRQVYFGEEWVETPVLRGEPPAGTVAEGPVVFELPEATLVLPPGWAATVDEAGTIDAGFFFEAKGAKVTDR